MVHFLMMVQLWKGCDDEELEEVMDCLERKILADDKVYSSIVSNMGQVKSNIVDTHADFGRDMHMCLGVD